MERSRMAEERVQAKREADGGGGEEDDLGNEPWSHAPHHRLEQGVAAPLPAEGREVRGGEEGQGHDAEDVMALRVFDVAQALGPAAGGEEAQEHEIEPRDPEVLRHSVLLPP